MVDFRRPDALSIKFVADNMREADRSEVWASHHHTPIDALNGSINQSGFSAVAWLGGEPCAIFGVVVCDILTGTGSPWLLGTNGIIENYREFLKNSHCVIDDMLRVCPKLTNHVHAGNKISVRWLKWLGFEFDRAQPYGVERELFYRFHLERFR